MTNIKTMLVAVFLMISATQYAQYTDIINSNRPGESMSAFSVGKTVIQAEMGVYGVKEKHKLLNYDVKGINARGDSIFGNINVEGKYGAGILNAENVSNIDINTEWVAYGKLKATDKNGNEYNLVVD